MQKTHKGRILINLSWLKYERLVKKLFNKLIDYKPEIIISNARGGLPLGVHLAHLLNIKTKDFGVVMSIRHEDDKIASNLITPEIDRYSLPQIKGKRVLLVEDTIGTGETLEVIRKFLLRRKPKELRIASMFLNQRNLEKKGIYYGRISTDKNWIVFPWERKI